MATRQLIGRLSQRIDELAERRGPTDHRPNLVLRIEGEDPLLRAASQDPSGRRPLLVVCTGMTTTFDPRFCTAASVAADLAEIKATIAGQRELAKRDTCNDFSGYADRLDREWRDLCAQVRVDYDTLEVLPGAVG